MALHDGCFKCGEEEQETLKSRTVTVIALKKDRKTGVLKETRGIASVALCAACVNETVIDMRSAKGQTVGV